jgi:hypothetical protein
MEHMGLAEGGCNVMWVVDCSSSHRSQNMLAMGAIMGTIQQPPFGPLSFKDFLGELNCGKPHNIIRKQVQCEKIFMWFIFHGS